MNDKFSMCEQDLLELYQLTALYKSTYHEDRIDSLETFLKKTGECYRKRTAGKDITRQTNPRKAGRKPVYTPRQNSMITELHQNRVSLRKIAVEIGCSLGHVQDIIRREKSYE